MTRSRNATAWILALAVRAVAAPAPASTPVKAPAHTVVVSTTSASPTATGLPAPKAPYWLKAYSTAPFEESWSATLSVNNLDADLPKVLKAITAAGGALTQNLDAFVSSKANHTQQLVLTVPRGQERALLKAWRRLGDLPTPQTRSPVSGLPADEVRAKIDRLMKERVERAADLAKLPVALELEDEVLEHLLLVESIAKDEDARIRIDLLVRQR